MKNNLFSLFFFCLFSVFSTYVYAGLESLPVQEGGRVKPFDTFAREQLSLLWGKETYNKQPATHVVLSWMIIPEEWEKTPFILVRHSGLRESLKLDNKQLYYSPREIMLNDRLGLLIQELKNMRQNEEKLNPFYQAVQTLESQISAFHAMRAGITMRVQPADVAGSTWKSVAELTGDAQEKFKSITAAFVDVATNTAAKNSAGELQAKKQLDTAVSDFMNLMAQKYPHYQNQTKIKAEVHYNSFHPFRWSWVSYFLALVFFSFFYFGTKGVWGKPAWTFLIIGMIFHVWGFALRIYILERPPVTNMFETVAWVAFVSIIMSIVLYAFNKAKILMLGSSLVATFSLILCDISSTVLDDSLTQLQPVLRDNFWLLTHVVIIVSSYAAFFLAFFIGDILLYYFYKDESKYHAEIQQGIVAIYRSIQVGVVLLAAGTILGGIWADYSWGRFWGWDPKETWAFIALLGYLVILHGRIIGWLKNYGLTAASVVAFSLVIMAWYGVNFVLGAGLHTYGFGAGGVEYVAGFVALHLLAVGYITTLRHSRLNQRKG